MGDSSNMHDIERFMRSSEGQAYLEETRQILLGRSIVDISFSNETQFIATTLHLDNGETFAVFQPSLEVGAIQSEFEDVIEREYYIDFPDRKPTEPSS